MDILCKVKLDKRLDLGEVLEQLLPSQLALLQGLQLSFVEFKGEIIDSGFARGLLLLSGLQFLFGPVSVPINLASYRHFTAYARSFEASGLALGELRLLDVYQGPLRLARLVGALLVFAHFLRAAVRKVLLVVSIHCDLRIISLNDTLGLRFRAYEECGAFDLRYSLGVIPLSFLNTLIK